MQSYLAVFDALKTERASEFSSQHGLIIKTGEVFSAATLKLIKPQWTTDKGDNIINTNGLFFSLWVDADCEAKGIVRYNVHAMKLREIMGVAFAAREFARSFRVQYKYELTDWPNWSFPKGPITLFEGHFPLDAASLHAETSQMMDKFAKLAPHLEKLLG